MFGLLLILLIGLGVVFYKHPSERINEATAKALSNLDRFWQIAQTALIEQKYIKAEKALLTILKVDDRNANAYNRLGIVYAKQGNTDDAITSFATAQAIESSATNLHNLGLIYYNIANYTKAEEAFTQALEIDNAPALRYIALAKVKEKLGDYFAMTELLEQAVKLESTPQNLKLLAIAYDRVGQDKLANKLLSQSKSMVAKQISSGKKTKSKASTRKLVGGKGIIRPKTAKRTKRSAKRKKL